MTLHQCTQVHHSTLLQFQATTCLLLPQANISHCLPLSPQLNSIRKWILRTNFRADGTLDKYKARLVTKEFQQTPRLDFSETFSLIVNAPTIRIIFSLDVSRERVQQIDMNKAFLNGILNEDVYMSQPEGFLDPAKPAHVCKAKKALYDLKQAPRLWFETLRTTLLKWGFQYCAGLNITGFLGSNQPSLIVNSELLKVWESLET